MPRLHGPLAPLALLVALAAACGGGGAPGAGSPSAGAEWIWAALPRRTAEPLAFYAVRDFQLAAAPRAAALRVQGDEEYVVYLNGRRVGSNRYREGAPLDVYPVGALLVPGANRLVAELRSARGAGGFLAALVDGDGRPLLTSDGGWTVLRRYRPGLVEGRASLAGGEPVHAWGRPPVGRWPPPALGPVRPTLGECGEPCAPRPAAAAAQDGAVARFDFGEEVVGYLLLARPPAAAAAGEPGLGLLALGDAPRDPLAAARRALPVVAVPGRLEWSDALPRRFRHAAVAGLGPGVTAAVVPVAEEALALLPPAAGREGEVGLFALDPPWRRNGVERAVRRRLASPRGAL